MRAGKAGKDYPVANSDMARECRVVSENTMIADLAIVRDMDVGHDPVVIAHSRDTPVLHGAATDRAVFENRIVVADLESCRLVVVLFVLGITTDRIERVEVIVAADARRPIDHDVAVYPGTRTDLHVVVDDRIRTDLDVISNDR